MTPREEWFKNNRRQFNIVAPIVIYHKADSCFEKQAKAAFKKLKRDAPLWEIMGRPESLDDVCEYEHYNELFRDIVGEHKPDWEEFRDKYSALGYKDENGAVVFAGDDCGYFPWYETAEVLIHRVQR
jgi:hypothetical protein